ncbi:MAG: AbrB/MazE/SpoVT family DNA-binding domain-containing protein [Candidatus Niyogibacteria bacterium]|nr:AbrB/MazE/SpoVT family DNA-binding domain-containing protein [Candidatus Niyogibacteria bacterium]
MPHKKKQNIRKLTRMGSGRSLGLTLPADILRDLHWREKQKVVVKRVGKKIIVEDWKKAGKK